MTSPYVYIPQASYQPTTYGNPYQPPSPFLPPSNVIPSSPYASPYGSPYGRPIGLPGGSPNRSHSPLPGTPNTPLRSLDSYQSYPGWPERQRRPSYHGPNPYEPSWLNTPQQPIGHTRRSSFGEHSYYRQPVGLQGYWPPPTNPFPSSGYQIQETHIHPFLNGESPRGDFLFDISAPSCLPLRYLGPGQTAQLNPDELAQPATWPSLTRLRIICDLIPQWPIDIELNQAHFNGGQIPVGYQPPPISIGDILMRVYEDVNQRITQMDWARLTPEEETEVGRAYTRRCKSFGVAEMVQRSQGVKRVDFLLGKVWFKGLTRVGEGWEVMKMHLVAR